MSATAIELHESPVATIVPTSSARVDEPVSQSEDILEASRLADSTVPDGGYGWIVIASCAVLTWHVRLMLSKYLKLLALANNGTVCRYKLQLGRHSR